MHRFDMACGCFINTAKNNETYQILIGFFLEEL